ncbi:MAG TPA: hypothetical protein ENO30_00745 [Thermodesulfobium narugense]|uniref:Uncharacterized protein n=1 Tax=Thermodesulfobium acidiphilum TaxID=1794699 RepID=A0A2R4VYP9_THEAF|nr:hypothetical protein [Thermodesulfobium acidiphilum]AWB09663.1 hypothetical protein TDSAC_0280 [Thermodesulfobium acidiphilum]PMP85533.1 MAG: hypothetical protein C0174_04200 [Thermodesulfobium narugense]HEM55267.1 hypothetical protein [Thermodesulfobium narugense]
MKRIKWYVYLIFILLVCLVVSNVYWIFNTKSIKENLDKNCQSNLESVREELQNKFFTDSKDFLIDIAIPLTYFVRDSLQSNRTYQVGECFNQIVKNKGFKEISFVSGDKIQISTNKKYEDSVFSKLYPEQFASFQKITVVSDQGKIFVVSPVMNVNEKIGFIIISYVLSQ